MSARTVHCGDGVAWLRDQPTLGGCSIITSLPDVSEVPPLGLSDWKEWFVDAAALALERCPPEGVAIFYQTDIKVAGSWHDKGFLVELAAHRLGVPLLWHKVVCRKPAGTVTFGRPAYSHFLCFSRGVRLDLGKATADVLPDAGHMPWVRAMGVSACVAACRFILEQTTTRTVVDPFCGRGTALAVANALGLDAVGVELSRRRARQARSLELQLSQNPASVEAKSPRDG